MAAISAVLFSHLRSGDAVVLPSDGYQLLPAVRTRLESYGIEVRTAPTAHDAQLDALDGARLLWIETPSNPGLDVCDIRRLADAAHRRARWSPSTTPLPPRSASAPSTSARTSRWPAAPRG